MATYTVNESLLRRESYLVWVQEHVRFSDTDLMGHTNNLAFGAFAETGRCMFLREFIEKKDAEHATFLPAQIVLNLLGEVFWPAQVDVGTAVLHIGNTSFRFGQGMFDADRCFATSESVFVLVDEVTRRPKSIPKPIRDWLSAYAIVESVQN
jgi:acyl-CoA thioester hydrolase